MEKLRAQLDKLIEKLENAEDLKASIKTLDSVFPFNEYEYIISHLLSAGKLTIDEYYELRNSYIDRNLYLYVFEISSPRRLGDTWAYGEIKKLVPEVKKPNKTLDPKYTGQQNDLWLDWIDTKNIPHGIRIELKIARALDGGKPDEPFYVKALASGSDKPFDMIFEQIKPRFADVFVWMGVWRDIIRYWVLSSNEVQNNKYYCPTQHKGNIGEGQLHLKHNNIAEFRKYEVELSHIKNAIIEAYKRQSRIK
jgi:hypothetical protein